MRFQLGEIKTFHLKPPPTTCQQLKHSKLQKKNPFCLSSYWFLTKGSSYQNRKANKHSPAPREKTRLFMIWFFDLLPIRPLMYTHSSSPKTLYPFNQIPVEKPPHVSLP